MNKIFWIIWLCALAVVIYFGGRHFAVPFIVGTFAGVALRLARDFYRHVRFEQERIYRRALNNVITVYPARRPSFWRVAVRLMRDLI